MFIKKENLKIVKLLVRLELKIFQEVNPPQEEAYHLMQEARIQISDINKEMYKNNRLF